MIHQTAVIEKGAMLGEDISIGPYAIIEEGVSLGNRVKVLAGARIKGNTTIGDDNLIGQGAIIGETPQMSGLRENNGRVMIGKNNIIREYVTIHSSTSPDKETCLGDDNFLMALSHVAHDCRLANGVILCNGSLLAGHIEVGDKAFISGNVVVHQFVRIGRLAMVGGLSRVNQDIPPFMLVVGDSRVWGLNTVGLKRSGMSASDRIEIKKTFELLYRSKLPLNKSLEEIKKINSPFAREIVDFIQVSKRGICGPKKDNFWERLFLDYPYLLRQNILTHSLFLKQVRSKDFSGKQLF
ncbi:MAG: acyl-ACP--UDP-N-acetylglucosamine O-acyltransferase [Candidatus Omnitrophica bacterium]|nr:acyl-ACP--UDP-N-acetylglucosamine O-acyltransferase [Candidatus Omnitrophota bacterium]